MKRYRKQSFHTAKLAFGATQGHWY